MSDTFIMNDTVEMLLALVTNSTGLVILLVLTIYSARTFSFKNKNNRYLYGLFIVSFVELTTHLLTTVAQNYGFYGSNNLGVIMYSFVFVVNSFFLTAWILYINSRLKQMSKQDAAYRRKLRCLSIPVLLLLALSILNMFTPIFFRYHNFEYNRLPAYYLTLLIPIGYLIYGIGLFIQSGHRRRIYQQLPFIPLMIPVVLAHILEWNFINLCCIPLANTITLMILVLTNVKQYSSVDGLTGLFTRRELYNYLEGGVKPGHMSGVMIDIDDFKSINDTYGHLVGDDALADFGHAIRNSTPAAAMGFRYAGDEFVILLPETDQAGAEKVLRQLREQLALINEKSSNSYILSASCGIAAWEKQDTPNTFIERMDSQMYLEKTEKHRQKNRQK